MKKPSRHLTRDDRSQIYTHKSNDLSNDRIASKLGGDRRTIDRGIKLNSSERESGFQQASAKTLERCKADSSVNGKPVSSLRKEIK